MIIKKENKHSKLIKGLFIGSLLILIGITVFGYDKIKDKKNKEEEKTRIKEFFNSDENSKNKSINTHQVKIEDNYIAIIEIPKVKLKTGMVNPDSKLNTVDKHIQILNKSDFPDVDGGNFILASHSGTSKISYFKHLNQLRYDDEIYIYYNDMKYTYKVFNIYKLNKNGKLTLYKYADLTVLTLTTCDTTDATKQLVVVAKQIGKEKIRRN